MLLDQCRQPVVLAPLAGGPSTPELCAAVCEAGGFGFLAAGYLTAAELADRIGAVRELTSRPFGVNVFVPGSGGDDAEVARYTRLIEPEAQRAGVALGEPVADDDDWAAKLDLLAGSPVPLVSFVFGLPAAADIARLQRLGSEVWVTVTSAADATAADAAGADGLVVQGSEAGGHRGGLTDTEGIGLLALLQLVRAASSLPLIAGGGVMTSTGLAAVLRAGAQAGALGTAFLLCPEAGTAEVHREAVRRADRRTALTRAFTGRLARGIRNRFLDAYSDAAPAAYPQVHHLTSPLRAHGRSSGDGEVVNLWAGEAYPLAMELPAAEVVKRVAPG